MNIPRSSSLLALTAVVGLAGVAAAQAPSVILPAEYARSWGGSTSSSALGQNTSRTQMIFVSPFAAGTMVQGVGIRGAGATTDKAAFTATVEVQMSSTAATPGALSSTFASNVGNDMVVAFPSQSVNIAAMPANRPTSLFVEFPFPAPFPFGMNGNPNICVDLFVHGRSAGASWSTDRGFASANGRVTTVGKGCGSATINSSSTGGSYVPGSTITFTMSSGPAMSAAILVGSADLSDVFPGAPLPFSLATLGGGAGCDVLVGLFPLLQFGVPIDAAGAASLPIPVPAGPAVQRLGMGWQWVYLNPATPAALKLETSANRAIRIGPQVLVPNAQYVYDLFSDTSATGTSTVDSCPIVKFVL